MGRQVGLEVVENEKAGQEEEETDENKEVQRIVYQGREVKILTGELKGLKGRKEYLFEMWCIKVERVEMIYFTCVLAVSTVATGHKMVVVGWALFEEAVNQARAGNLPQLLLSIRTMTTPPPLTTPPQGASMDIIGTTPGPSPVKKEGGKWGGSDIYESGWEIPI